MLTSQLLPETNSGNSASRAGTAERGPQRRKWLGARAESWDRTGGADLARTREVDSVQKKNRQPSRKKGEDGYWERNTGAATEAAAVAHAVFPNAETFTAAANRYFDECDARDELYGEAGLCLALSRYNPGEKNVTLKTLRKWYDGEACPYLQEAVQMAYLRIQQQVESDPRYRDKATVTRGIFLQKQPRLGGYQDKIEQKTDTKITIIHGDSMEESDFL